MKARTMQSFGARLVALRRQRGLTQAGLGQMVGVSQRVVAYYETESRQPPGALLADLTCVLNVSSDQLLGLTSVVDKTPPKLARLRKRLQKAETLRVVDQRAILKLIDALHAVRLHERANSRQTLPARAVS
jgi:transcriptional regulator with XRE-family HTH domain